MNDIEKCPCSTVENLIKKLEEQEDEIAKQNTEFAVIRTKLNMIMGISGAIALSTFTIIAEFLFK